MPSITNNSQWLSNIQANDRAVYKYEDGEVTSGYSLKGALVSIAETLGIFKEATRNFRVNQARANRDVYEAAWNRVAQDYGVAIKRETQKAMADKGYAEAWPAQMRLTGKNAADPKRFVTGRELREIIDTARSIRESYGDNPPAEPKRQSRIHNYLREERDYLINNFTTLPKEERAVLLKRYPTDSLHPRPPRNLNIPHLGMTVIDIPESLWDPLAWGDPIAVHKEEMRLAAIETQKQAAEAARLTEEAAKLGAKVKIEAPKEMERALTESNTTQALERIRTDDKLSSVASRLGFDSKEIVDRAIYVRTKMRKRIENDPRCKAGTITDSIFDEIAKNVFQKAMKKSLAVAGLKGAVRKAEHNVASVLRDDIPKGNVNIAEVMRDDISTAAHDIERLKRLAAKLDGSPVKRVKPSRILNIEQTALRLGDKTIREKQVPLTAAEVDDILTKAIAKSLEHGEAANRAKGATKFLRRAIRLGDSNLLIMDTQDVQQARTQDRLNTIREQIRDRGTPTIELASPRTTTLADSPTVTLPGAQADQTRIETSPPAETRAEPTRTERGATTSAKKVTPQPKATAASLDKLPTPLPYNGVDYFDTTSQQVSGLPTAVLNYQRANQVLDDYVYFNHGLRDIAELSAVTPVHSEYIKTTLLKRVEAFHKDNQTALLSEQALAKMLNSVIKRAFEIGSTAKLKAKTLYKNKAAHIGKSSFERGISDIKKEARKLAGERQEEGTLLNRAMRSQGVNKTLSQKDLKAARRHLKETAEKFVAVNMHLPSENDWDTIAVEALERARLIPRQK